MGRGVTKRVSAKLCMHTMNEVCYFKGLFCQSTIFGLFSPDIKSEMGVVNCMYLKHSPDYIDSKYIWVYESNSLGSGVFVEIPIIVIFSITQVKEQV